MKKMQYNVIEINNEYWIELMEDPFDGIRYRYGKVEFMEPENEGDDAILKFDFEVYDKALVESCEENKLFHSVIGDILVGFIEKQLENGEVVYTGGV